MTIDSRQAAGSDGRPLKVGILGAGYIADWHLKALRRVRQAQVVALADLDIRRARSLSADYSIAQAYGSLEEMLAGESLDVLHVLTPPQTHYPAAKLALESGVHVLLEKPMCIDRRHAIELNLLAQSRTRCVGVNHNFLFTKEYEQLRSALTAGSIGRIDHVSIVWNKPLGQLVSGPFDLWMLREPQNIVLEIGPHLVAHLLDLVDYPQAWRVHVDNEAELPGQRTFYRRWRLSTDHGRAAADLLMSFNPGNTEHYIHVRGSNGSARVDFENQTFALDRPTPYGVDFDRYRRVRASARAVGRQARRNLIDYVLSKFKLSERGNAFGYSIQRSLQAFYASVTGAADSRMSTQLGVDVVNLCHDIADQVRSDIPPPEAVCSAKPLVVANHRRGESDVFHTGLNGTATASCSTACALADREYVATTLVLGGTGFIGKELVRQLVERNYRVKVLSR
ncbi:MAG TPA: Gfo/Idh/MocA family oxidoreductase, partial [Pirellulales bacterium]|nr:Gfo/Idh/MocA family oxidoreductase [Pirellulales bacterium]